MCRGEIRSLYLPMDLAWGEKPPQPLPANASVHYKVSHCIQHSDTSDTSALVSDANVECLADSAFALGKGIT